MDALVSATGSGGVKRRREEEDVGVKDSPSKRAKTAHAHSRPSYIVRRRAS